jgi:UDP-N-acetylmuramate dehydrogenase
VTWRANLPPARGKLIPDAPLAPYTWLRVGGPADVLFLPADVEDLAAFLAALDPAIPVTAIGVGSNLLVRDGGVDGVVIRLAGRAFAAVEPRGDGTIFAGAAALDAAVAKVAATEGIAGLEFLRGVPGTIGGALTMNAGCYGAETKDVLVEAYAVDRSGQRFEIAAEKMGFSYRRSEAAATLPLIFTGALFRGDPADSAIVTERMEAITARRETTQPIREKTGGSTFKNPPATAPGGSSTPPAGAASRSAPPSSAICTPTS